MATSTTSKKNNSKSKKRTTNKKLVIRITSKAKTISKYLGTYTVVASKGHIRDLPKVNRN